MAGSVSATILLLSSAGSGRRLPIFGRPAAGWRRASAGLTRGLADVGSAFASTSARVTVFAAAVTGAAFAAGAFIRNSLNRVDDLGDLASSLGVTVTQLQTFQAAATASGIDSTTLSRGFISIGEALKELQGTTAKATSGNVRFSQFT